MRPSLLASLLLFAVLPACTASEGEEDEASDEAAFTAEDAACFDAPLRTGESPTDARARCLTDYASRLVDAQVARAEDPRDASLAAFKGKVRVAGETGCFTEDVSGGGFGTWQYDIDSQRDVGMLGVQIRAAIEFLKHYGRDLDGYPNHLFDTVEICPQGQVEHDLSLTGSRLRIGVRTGWFGRYGFFTGPVLRDKWTKGEHLAGNPALEKLGGLRWAVIDPVGTPRTTLRRALRGLVARLSGSLGALRTQRADRQRPELERLIRESTAPGATDEHDRSIRERALARVAELPAEGLADFIDAWRVELERDEVAFGSEEGAVTMRDVLNLRDVKINVNQYGFVNVNNFKQISVDTELFLPNASRFERYVEVERTESTVEVNQYGLVNVQLNDVVTVRVQVLYGRTAQTASLDRLLGP